MRIAVLFDGAGLARLGLEKAGHECVGVELNPIAHYLGQFVGSGNCVLGDATTFSLKDFDAVWCSPPCQKLSSARTSGPASGSFATNYLNWCLNIDSDILWVENVSRQGKNKDDWGTLWNAAQFTIDPIQCRNRVIGGSYSMPRTYRGYRRSYGKICPTITATEYKGCASDTRRASRFYGRKLTIEECAYHQGFEVPIEWHSRPEFFDGTDAKWRYELYRAIGNGVPVYMAKAFGEAHS